MKIVRLDETNSSIQGTTFGIPFKKGEVSREQLEQLKLFANNHQLESSVIPSAYWPDRSIKWAAIMSNVDGRVDCDLNLKPGSKNTSKLEVIENDYSIIINNGILKIEIDKKNNTIIDSAKDMMGRKLIDSQKLVATAINGIVESVKTAVTIENQTDVRIVIKCSFDLVCDKVRVFKNDTRIYVYLNSGEIKYSTTMFVDEGANLITINNLGIKTECNLDESEPLNRFARFSLQDGSYTEPHLSLATRRYMKNNDFYTRQLKAKHQDIKVMPLELVEMARTNPTWNNYLLKHNNSQVYNLSKSTSLDMQSVKIDEGIKSNGGFSISNGIEEFIVVPTNFWEKYPSAVEITNLGNAESSMTFWINHNNEMKFNHYSDKHHFNCYEGFEFIKSTAVGTANTSEFYLSIGHSKTNNDFYQYCEDKQKANLFITDEEIYRTSLAAGVYGERRTKNSKDYYLEQAADEMLSFYNNEIDQRSWYGYWDFGDVMHTFDNHRGQWWYDSGGYAWQNTELNPNMWLWYSFLRNQDLTSYKMAYNMSRHNSDTDIYHFGEYKGLGSRHNVLHYGCSCKEPRISMAHLYRIFYYLHFDERVGEVMDMVIDVDKTMDKTGPFDEFYEKIDGKTHMRIGPDWASLCSNWMVKYERTLEEEYLNRINAGIESIDSFENNLLEGPEVLYDNESRKLYSIGSGLNNGYHMTISFGAPQVWADYCMTFKNEKFMEYMNEFAIHYFRDSAEMKALHNGMLTKDLFHWPEFAIGIYAYSSYLNNDQHQIEQAKAMLNEFMATNSSLMVRREVTRHKELIEYDNVSTNCVAQWCLNTFQVFGYEDLIKN